MDGILEIGLTNAVFATVLALALRLVERRLHPALVHGLWLLILAKLFCPPLAQLGLPLIPAPMPTMTASALTAPSSAASALIAAAPASASWADRAQWVWLLGALVLLAVAVVRSLRFHALVRDAQVADAALDARVRRLATQMGVNRPPWTVVTEALISPVLWAGFGARHLVIPRALLVRLSEPELDALILHELAHLRRGSHWARLLESAAVALFWWLPVAWWARHRSQVAEERCCDALVTQTRPDRRRAYADCLLETVRFLAGKPAPAIILASPMGDAEDLKERLTMILEHATPKSLSHSTRWAMTLAVIVVLAVFPTLVQAEGDDDYSGEPLRLQVDDATVGQVLGKLAAVSGLNLIVVPEVDLTQPISMDLEGVPWDQALDMLVDAAGLGYSLEGNVAWIHRAGSELNLSTGFSGDPINVRFDGADLAAALDQLGQAADLRILLEDGIAGRVSVHLVRVPWDQALDIVVRLQGLTYDVNDGTIQVHRPYQETQPKQDA